MTKMVAIVSLSLAIVVLTIVGMNVTASNKAFALEQQGSVENTQSQVAKERVENNHVATSLASTEVGEKVATQLPLAKFDVIDNVSLSYPHSVYVYAMVDWTISPSSIINSVTVDNEAYYTEWYSTRAGWIEGTSTFNSKFIISQSHTVLSSDKKTVEFSIRIIRKDHFVSSTNEIRYYITIENSSLKTDKLEADKGVSIEF